MQEEKTAITLDELAERLDKEAEERFGFVFGDTLKRLRRSIKNRDILLDMKKLSSGQSLAVQNQYVDYARMANSDNMAISYILYGLIMSGYISLEEHKELSAELYNLTFEAAPGEMR